MYKFECFDNDDIQYDEVSIRANYDADVRVHFGKSAGHLVVPAIHSELGVACIDMMCITRFLDAHCPKDYYVRTIMHCNDDAFFLTFEYK